MKLIGRYDQVKTPQDIREEEYLESVYREGERKGMIIGTIICNIIFVVVTLIFNLIVK